MGSAAEITEPTSGTEKHHQPVEAEEEDEQVFELERKISSTFRHGKRPDSADSSTVTNTSSSSSSSFSGDGTEGIIPDFRNGDGEHVTVENLEVPDSPEIGIHEEHEDGSSCNVYFDGELGSESAGAEPDAHESQPADRLNGETKHSESDNGSASEDNKGPRENEIEEVQAGEVSKSLDAVDQPIGDLIVEEEREIKDVDDYDVEKVLKNQETHDLFCPICNSCITERVVLKRRKRKIPHPLLPSEGAVLENQSKPREEATGDSNWFSSMFGFKKEKAAPRPGGTTSSVPDANLPRDNLNLPGEDTTGSGSTANASSKAPALVQDAAATPIQEISVSQDKEPVDTPLIQVANSHDPSKVVNNGATVEDGQKFLVPKAEEEQTQHKTDKDDAIATEGNHSSEKGRLSPIQPSRDMNISNTVTSGPDGVRVETIFHSEGVSHLFEGADARKPDFGLTNIPSVLDTGGERGVVTGTPSTGTDVPPLPVSSLEEGTLIREPLLVRPVVEGRKLEILKSIVYGGLIESITSLGVISSAAGSGASTLNILVLGLANLFGGLILIIHNLQELREEEPRRTTTEDNQTNGQEEGRYKRLLGRRENFTLHATVALLSFIIVGLLPPIVYYFSFSKTHNRDYKVASVFGSSLLCIVLLALAKAHVRNPRGSHLKSVLYYALIAVSVSGISYVVGDFVDHLLEKYGWSDGSETPVGDMMLSLMGRKAGSFGYSSSSY
ncbi:unnamed protein product [Thlaspi arvense]|uniref:Membrane protein of ER body-like protein n=1 Tax=Thlaspi arvense TaxID=13288 RepID=A0AAU9T4D8_THLAR|nr:unnamed protein product [Thlaspi arvense]